MSHRTPSNDNGRPRVVVIAFEPQAQRLAAELGGPEGSFAYGGWIRPLPADEPAADDHAAAHSAPGLPLGDATDLEALLEKSGAEIVAICLPAGLHALAGQLARRAEASGQTVRLLATVADQLHGRTAASSGGRVTIDVNHLLDRPARPVDEIAIGRTLHAQRVLITGAGGSIGSELAKIAAGYGPAELLLMDRSENGLFEIDRRLAAEHPGIARRLLLHDVTQAQRTAALLRRHRPGVIFHAAAHKHVPMMEDHPRQAIINNFFGTRSVADAARAAGCGKFVMVSTDKAVNPSSVMGATKRLAELYIQHLNSLGGTEFSMVRFGNVLGSACSVAPIWTEQLAGGGPITVTDPRMTRYFMTIPEAATLVIQAASLDDGGGRIFVLDMGDPIRILDLANRFVRMHGLEPGRDVKIAITGARPGEKLFEELAYDSENMQPTAHASVRILKTEPQPPDQILRTVRLMRKLARCEDPLRIIRSLRQTLPEMVQPIEDRAADRRGTAA